MVQIDIFLPLHQSSAEDHGTSKPRRSKPKISEDSSESTRKATVGKKRKGDSNEEKASEDVLELKKKELNLSELRGKKNVPKLVHRKANTKASNQAKSETSTKATTNIDAQVDINSSDSLTAPQRRKRRRTKADDQDDEVPDIPPPRIPSPTEQLDPILLEDPEQDANSATKELIIQWDDVSSSISNAPITRGLPQNQPKETFPNARSDQPHGPSNIPSSAKTCIDYFLLFFDAVIVSTFVAATNAFGAAKAKAAERKWQDFTDIQFLKFVGVILYMGLVKQPTIKSFWSMDFLFERSWLKKVFSRDEFLRLLNHLHFRDTSSLSEQDRQAESKKDGFWLVSPFLHLLCANFQKFFTCGRLLDIDEMCIFFKGRHRCRCYNPKKPNKYHFKAFCLNDSKTGYLHSFYMYERGK